MNTSLQSIIDEALHSEHVEDTYPVYDEAAYLDEDTVKLAHALDFLSGNLDNIGTVQERLADLYEIEKIAVDPYTKAFGNWAAQQPDYASGNVTKAQFEAANPQYKDLSPNQGLDPAAEKARRQQARQVSRQAQANVEKRMSKSTKDGVRKFNIDPKTGQPIMHNTPAGKAQTTQLEALRESRKGNAAHVKMQQMNRNWAGPASGMAGAEVKSYNRGVTAGTEAGVAKGKATAGFGDAIKNTWKKGIGGKAALIGGGALAAGLAGKAMFGGEKTGSLKLAARMGLNEDQYYVMEKAAQLRGISTHAHLLQRAAQMNEDSILGAGLRNQ